MKRTLVTVALILSVACSACAPMAGGLPTANQVTIAKLQSAQVYLDASLESLETIYQANAAHMDAETAAKGRKALDDIRVAVNSYRSASVVLDTQGGVDARWQAAGQVISSAVSILGPYAAKALGGQ